MRLFVGRIASWIVVACGWLLVGARTVLDLIGYSTLPDDAKVAATLVESFISWLFSIPWWAVFAFALSTSMWLMWLSWPREAKSSGGGSGSTTPTLQPTKETQAEQTISPVKKDSAIPAPSMLTVDVQRKVAAIDAILDIIAPGGQLRHVIEGYRVVRNEWERHGGNPAFVATVEETRNAVLHALNGLSAQNERTLRHPDVQALLAPVFQSDFPNASNEFVAGLRLLGIDAQENHKRFCQPAAQKDRLARLDLLDRMDRATAAIAAIRKNLSL